MQTEYMGLITKMNKVIRIIMSLTSIIAIYMFSKNKT